MTRAMDTVDADWIRQRLSPAHGSKARLAAAVGLPTHVISKIIKGERRVQANEVPRFLAYFGESLGAPPASFAEDAPEFHQRDVIPTSAPDALVKTIAPGILHPLTYNLARALPGCGLMAGDLLVIDADATDTDGLVVATHWHDDGSADTMLMRRLGHMLLSPDPLAPSPILQIGNGPELAVIGRIAAVLRRNPLGEAGAA